MDVTGFPALDRTVTLASELRARLADQTRQSGSGQRSDTYAGLGADARRAIDLRSEMARQDSLSRAAERAGSRATATQTVLTRMTEIASDLASKSSALLGSSGADNAAMMAQSARTALREVASLLNEQFEGESLFGGADLDGTPVPGDIEDSGLFKQIASTLQGMTSGSGAATRAALRDLGASNDAAITPFSERATAGALGEIDDPRRSVPVEQGVTVEIGMYANRNAAARPSTAADSTGSWSRDLLYGLSVIANLGTDQAALGDDFTEVVQGAIGALRAGLSGLTEEAGALGTVEARLTSTRAHHDEVSSQLEEQLAGVEGVDVAEAISRAQATQTQLEASYRCLSMLTDMSLSKYLG